MKRDSDTAGNGSSRLLKAMNDDGSKVLPRANPRLAARAEKMADRHWRPPSNMAAMPNSLGIQTGDVAFCSQVAKAKGWQSVVFTGNDAFLRRAFAMALAEGIEVYPKDDEQTRLWIEIRSGACIELPPPPAASAIAHMIEREQKGFCGDDNLEDIYLEGSNYPDFVQKRKVGSSTETTPAGLPSLSGFTTKVLAQQSPMKKSVGKRKLGL